VSGDSRKSFFRRVDRSAVQYQDPFPGLEHEMAEVNGIRCSKLRATQRITRKLRWLGPASCDGKLGRHGSLLKLNLSAQAFCELH